MKMEFDQLVELTCKEKKKEMVVFQWIKLIFLGSAQSHFFSCTIFISNYHDSIDIYVEII
jgi:hypothetical protein